MVDANGKEMSPIAFQIRKAMLREQSNQDSESTSGDQEEMEIQGDGEYQIYTNRKRKKYFKNNNSLKAMRKDLDSIKNATSVPLNNKFNPLTNKIKIIEVPQSKKLPPFNITLSETQTSDTVGKLVKTLSFKPVLIHRPQVKEISVHVATLNHYRALKAKLNDSDINYYIFTDAEYNPFEK